MQNAWVQCPKPAQCLAGTFCRDAMPPAPEKRVDFKDAQRLFAAAKSYELARSLMIFQVYAIPTMVKNASQLYKTATKTILGSLIASATASFARLDTEGTDQLTVAQFVVGLQTVTSWSRSSALSTSTPTAWSSTATGSRTCARPTPSSRAPSSRWRSRRICN